MHQTVYHGSRELFESFTLASAGQTSGASNGGLGVWVTPDIDVASAFHRGDGFLYELKVAEGSIKEVPLQWLKDRHAEAADIEQNKGIEEAVRFYDRIRLDLIAEGFAQIWILERDGTAFTRVVLEPDDIEIISVAEVNPPAPSLRSVKISYFHPT
jgi:hypothetical protein